jgi:hypothetical protein
MRESVVSYLREQDFESQRKMRVILPATINHCGTDDDIVENSSRGEPQRPSTTTRSTPPTITISATTIVTDWAKVVSNVTSQSTPAPAPHEHLVMVMVMVLLWTAIMSSIIYFAESFPSNTRELFVGVVVNLNLVFFYGAPLSSIYL